VDDRLWIFKKPQVYPAGPRPEVRISPLLEEARRDRALEAVAPANHLTTAFRGVIAGCYARPRRFG